MAVVVTALASLGLKLITTSVIEKVLMLALKELVKSTSSKADDELYTIVDEAINGKK